MTTSYALMRFVLASSSQLPISRGEYDELKAAQEGLLQLRFAEEKFDVVLQNYLEIEVELLSSTARDVVCSSGSYDWFHSERILLNRRMLNLLSSTRGYTDHMGHVDNDLGNVMAQSINAKFSERYDASLGYRLMDALRNYTQHRGFPIHSLTYKSKRIADTGRNRFRCGINIYVSRSELAEDPKFKKKVLNELASDNDLVELKSMFRDYVADLAAVHEWFRQEMSNHTTIWEQRYESAISRFATAFPHESSAIGLAAAVINGKEISGKLNLLSDFIEYRRTLVAKNSSAALKRLGVLYVSSESTDA
jgi:hypothetical protein